MDFCPFRLYSEAVTIRKALIHGKFQILILIVNLIEGGCCIQYESSHHRAMIRGEENRLIPHHQLFSLIPFEDHTLAGFYVFSLIVNIIDAIFAVEIIPLCLRPRFP